MRLNLGSTFKFAYGVSGVLDDLKNQVFKKLYSNSAKFVSKENLKKWANNSLDFVLAAGALTGLFKVVGASAAYLVKGELPGIGENIVIYGLAAVAVLVYECLVRSSNRDFGIGGDSDFWYKPIASGVKNGAAIVLHPMKAYRLHKDARNAKKDTYALNRALNIGYNLKTELEPKLIKLAKMQALIDAGEGVSEDACGNLNQWNYTSFYEAKNDVQARFTNAEMLYNGVKPYADKSQETYENLEQEKKNFWKTQFCKKK
jgi:hypothetical protein